MGWQKGVDLPRCPHHYDTNHMTCISHQEEIVNGGNRQEFAMLPRDDLGRKMHENRISRLVILVFSALASRYSIWKKKDLTSRLFNLAMTGQTCAHMRSCCWTFFRGTIKANYVKTPQTGFTANRVHFGTLLSEYAFGLFEMTVIYPTEIINTPP